MDEQAALAMLADELGPAGDDAAVIDELVLTTDMLHEATDFPAGTTHYTVGWRSVGASLSDVAAMGADPVGAVGVYAAPSFDREEVLAFVDGARDVCDLVETAYVGGDLDQHQELTVATAAVGRASAPVGRRGARPGDAVCVTGTLGRTAAALRYFEAGAHERANELFQFEPRVSAGLALAGEATAMMDSSDGLARSLHQLATASECGFAIDSESIPIDDAVSAVADDDATAEQLAISVGEDFELVATVPPGAIDSIRALTETQLTEIGTVTQTDVELDGEPLPDSGYTHGED